MSILYMDNFFAYGTGTTGVANMLDGTPWAGLTPGSSSNSPIADPDPNTTGSRVLRLSFPAPNYSSMVRAVISEPHGVAGLAARYWLESIPGGNTDRPILATFRNAGNTVMYSLAVSPNGALEWHKGTSVASNNSTLVATTIVPVVTSNAWYHIESKVDLTAGTLSVQLEGIPLESLDYTEGAPPLGSVYIVGFANAPPGGGLNDMYIKDFILWNGGGTLNNDFIGPAAVYNLPVSADVSSGWARSSGSSDYALLDEAPPVDTDYISAADTLPAPSIMSFENLPADIVSVRAIMTKTRARKTDGGDAKLQVSLSPDGAVWADGADRAITTAMTYWHDISELNPDTAAPWAPTEVNTAEVKLNRTL